MATVSLLNPDGRRGLLAFTSTATLAAWQSDARPVAATSQRVAQAALQEGADAVLLDVAGPVRFPIERARAAARWPPARPGPPAHRDPEVHRRRHGPWRASPCSPCATASEHGCDLLVLVPAPAEDALGATRGPARGRPGAGAALPARHRRRASIRRRPTADPSRCRRATSGRRRAARRVARAALARPAMSGSRSLQPGGSACWVASSSPSSSARSCSSSSPSARPYRHRCDGRPRRAAPARRPRRRPRVRLRPDLLAYAFGPVSGAHVNPAVTLGMLSPAGSAARTRSGTGSRRSSARSSAPRCSSSSSARAASPTRPAHWAPTATARPSNGGARSSLESCSRWSSCWWSCWSPTRPPPPAPRAWRSALALTAIHLVGIPLTGTSVNPARSLGPALFAGGDALGQLWLFILAPAGRRGAGGVGLPVRPAPDATAGDRLTPRVPAVGRRLVTAERLPLDLSADRSAPSGAGRTSGALAPTRRPISTRAPGSSVRDKAPARGCCLP